MKKSVLFNALNTLKHYGLTDPFSIIAQASLCDFFVNKKLLAERLTKSFIDDVNFCTENFAEFKIIKELKYNFEYLSLDNNDKLYKELKHQSYIQSDVNENDLSILDLIETTLSFGGKSQYTQSAEKVLSVAIANWLANGNTGKTIYCPFNNLINIEIALSSDNTIISPNISCNLVFAKTMYFICNGLNVPEQPFTDPEKLGSLTETYDAGFSFPPFAWRIKNKNNGENLILKDMLNNITGRFALIFYMGFTFQAGSSELLRKQIITEKRLKAIVELPSGFVPGTNVTSVVMFFDKTDDSQDSIMVMSLSDDTCKDKDNSNRYRTVLNEYAVNILNNGLQGKESLFCKKVSFTEIEKNEFCLSPSRYILSSEEQVAKQQILNGDTKLCDIATFHRVQAIRPENKGNTYYEVNASSINAMGFIENPEKQICLTNENAASKNTLKKNDIVFAIKGSVGKVGFVAEEHDNWLINQSFVIIRITDPKWPAEYVFRQLKSTAMKLYIQSKTIGSVIPSLTIGELKNLPLVSPTEEGVKEQLTKHKRQLEIIQNIDKLKKELNNLNNF